MPAQILQLVPQTSQTETARFDHERSMAEILVSRGALSADNLKLAQSLQAGEDVELREILLSRQMVTPQEVAEALALEWGTTTANLDKIAPDPRLVDRFGADLCLRAGFIPYRRIGASTLIATARPEALAELFKVDPHGFANCHMTIADEQSIEAAVTRVRSAKLVEQAEARVSAELSCRNWNTGALRILMLCGAALIIACAIVSPALAFAILCGWAVLTLVLTAAMKVTATYLVVRAERAKKRKRQYPVLKAVPEKLPKVSILVALYREENLAAHLVERLRKLDYPRELLEICLVVEADDLVTRTTIEQTDLPGWFRTIPVPRGTIKTKPRALNYALDFCRGSIIGIYDAEDAPAPDQIHKIVERFEETGPEVACLQGILDFYNAPTNWLSRCFTAEYASWFRVVLRGVEKMGFAVPLGGTTVFFRRAALEELGAWDAHNVTEDADLGIRIARRGYRTEIIETVTHEEANCRALPWIKQRSRWLKGYAMTWAVHMRAPRTLWRDLGAWRFLGFQIIFLGALSQFVLAPILWSFWLMLFGLPHPLTGQVPDALLITLAVFFFSTELLGIAVGFYALRGDDHRWLRKWVPTLMLYYPLGVLASYKGLWEMVTRPYYWDKTAHGIFPAVSSRAKSPDQSL